MSEPKGTQMSLRDLFAAHAAAALVTSRSREGGNLKVDSLREIAIDAYAMADAMLAERVRRRDNM